MVANLDWSRVYPGGGNPNERYALLVGVNDYPGEDLDLGGGPMIDLEIMHSTLTQRFGFKPENVLVLRDLEGNRDQLIEAFRRHLGQAGPGGLAFFYYSGHGMQMPDNRGLDAAQDPETDGKDEALAVWGTQGDLYGYLLDDELGILTSELKAGRVMVMLDDCFAGTATRGVKPAAWKDLAGNAPAPAAFDAVRVQPHASAFRSRAIRAGEVRGQVETARSHLTKAANTPNSEYHQPANHVLLAASADSETSVNFPIKLDDGRVVAVGLFTAVFYATLNESPADITIADLMARVSAKTREVATQFRGQPQTPQVEGQRAGESLARYLGAQP